MILSCWQSNENIRRLGLSLLVGMAVILLAACNRNSASTPPPNATINPTASATLAATVPSATATLELAIQTPESVQEEVVVVTPSVNGVVVAADDGGVIFTSPRYSYTLTLPCCWVALPTGTTIGSTLPGADSQTQSPAWGDLGELMSEVESGAVLELIALLPDAENAARPVAQMTVSVLPVRGLTLDGYLAATEAELNQIANTSVLTANVDSTLGAGGLPASVIEYTAAPTPATNNNEETIAGYQVAFFSQDQNSLIVLTFTTSTERFAELQPAFLQIVRTVAFVVPSA